MDKIFTEKSTNEYRQIRFENWAPNSSGRCEGIYYKIQQLYLVEAELNEQELRQCRRFFWTEENGTVAAKEDWRFLEETKPYGLKLLS